MTGSIRNKILVVFYLSSVLSLLGYILIYLLSQQQGELVEDSAQIPPVTEAWFRLNNGMQHAVSSQREWLLSGNSIFREGRMNACLLYTSPSPRDRQKSRMPSSA